ncbi:MAG: hypothetical protein AAF335_01565 [Bacteroidota bacterium]
MKPLILLMMAISSLAQVDDDIPYESDAMLYSEPYRFESAFTQDFTCKIPNGAHIACEGEHTIDHLPKDPTPTEDVYVSEGYHLNYLLLAGIAASGIVVADYKYYGCLKYLFGYIMLVPTASLSRLKPSDRKYKEEDSYLEEILKDAAEEEKAVLEKEDDYLEDPTKFVLEEEVSDEEKAPLEDDDYYSSSYCYSTANNRITISNNIWAISIMRKPNTYNPDHAFLMVEGITNDGYGIIRRYDLVKKGESGFSKIIKKEKKNINISEMESIFCKEFLKRNTFCCKTWSIRKRQAASLDQDVVLDINKDIRYCRLGNRSLVAASTNSTGHSCFTWAREKLHNLEDRRIELPEKITDYFGAKTSFYIYKTDEATSFYIRRIGKHGDNTDNIMGVLLDLTYKAFECLSRFLNSNRGRR